jgi:2-dehydro-3-deoxyphosphooctonate aldolase (KDO 8-P synthase)
MSKVIDYLQSGTSLFFIAGPCVIESRRFALETAEELNNIFAAAGLPFLYKSSFDKANRSSSVSFRGVGMKEGLSILAEVRDEIGIPVLTDVHESWQAETVAGAVDMLQTPAFLCRQTDFIVAVASAGKPVNIKKGQFLAPWDMQNVTEKARATGNKYITVCERGTSFGYGNLVVDMRGLPIMAETTGCPVVFDATHSVQLPGAQGGCSGGQREFAPYLARAAVATGAVSGVFMEVHPNPDRAPCDGPNMMAVKDLPRLLAELKGIHKLVKSR